MLDSNDKFLYPLSDSWKNQAHITARDAVVILVADEIKVGSTQSKSLWKQIQNALALLWWSEHNPYSTRI